MFIQLGGRTARVGCARQVQRHAAEHVARLQAEIPKLETEYEMLRALRNRADYGKLSPQVRAFVDRREAQVGIRILRDMRQDLETVWKPLMQAQLPFCGLCAGYGVQFIGYGGESIRECDCGGTGVEP